MKTLLRTITWLAATVASVVVLGSACWWLLGQLLAWIMAQPSQLAAALITVAGSVIVGIGGVVYSQQRGKSREIAEAHRPNKTALYSEFISLLVGTMRQSAGAKKTDPRDTKKMEDAFFEFTTRAMLWGSPGVLTAYANFRRAGGQESPQIVFLVDDILQAMRKDLGLSNWGLSRGDLIKMLITDPDSLDQALKGSA